MDWPDFIFKDAELQNFANAVKYLMQMLVNQRPEFASLLEALEENDDAKAKNVISKLEGTKKDEAQIWCELAKVSS